MKRTLRCLAFLALILALGFVTPGTNTSNTARAERVIDPTCVSLCTFLMQECFRDQGSNRSCLGLYRQCIAHCEKDQ